MLRLFLLLILTGSGANAMARMYQWMDPVSRTTQLSGVPPAWYRSSTVGPRVFVFEKGALVDDTWVMVSHEQRQGLRELAFIKLEEERELAKQKLLQAKRSELSLQQDQEELALMEEEAGAKEGTQETTEAEEMELSIGKMRAMISEWEQRRTDNAKKSIEAAATP